MRVRVHTLFIVKHLCTMYSTSLVLQGHRQLLWEGWRLRPSRHSNILSTFYLRLCLVFVLSLSLSLSMSCLCLVCVLFVSCLCLVCVFFISCLCLVYVMSMSNLKSIYQSSSPSPKYAFKVQKVWKGRGVGFDYETIIGRGWPLSIMELVVSLKW